MAMVASVVPSFCCLVRLLKDLLIWLTADILLHLALEGADVTVTYLPEEEQDVKGTANLPRKKTNDSLKFQFLPADLTCQDVVQKHLDYFGGQLDTPICNHGNQDTVSEITELVSKCWLDTFDINIHSFFDLTKAATPYLQKSSTKQSTIVFNDSINLFKGNLDRVDEILEYLTYWRDGRQG